MTEIRFDTRGGRKKALILVPHQDDELNASMNLLLWLKKAGIETYVAYSTNGDWRFSVDRRYTEAVSVCAKLGIGRDHVIFLGYGDWLNSEKHDHLFYADEVPAVSPAGFSHTYGGKQVRDLAYSLRNEHSPYTFPAFCRDISLLVETFLPDLIVCTDLDEHADHRALSLAFDKVMGEILKKRDDYHPQVLKRFAYCTAYAAEADFYEGGAVPETKQPRAGKTEKYAFDLVGSLYYDWEKRLRIPAYPGVTERVLRRNIAAQLLAGHKSQNIVLKADRIINSDEVYWERRTDSLACKARVSASSGDPSPVSDFQVIGLTDIDAPVPVCDGYLWQPDAGDEEKCLVFEWDLPRTVTAVRLYGNIGGSGRILDASVTLDSGLAVRTGVFPERGRYLSLTFPAQHGVRKAEIRIEKTEGSGWGIGECEFFAENEQKGLLMPFAKITVNGSFAGTYDLGKYETGAKLGVYSWGETGYGRPETSAGEILPEGTVLKLAAGEDAEIFLKSASGEMLDSVKLHRMTDRETRDAAREKMLDEAWLKGILLKKKTASLLRLLRQGDAGSVITKLTGGKKDGKNR